MFRMLRDQNLAPLNCCVLFETLIFLENSHFIEFKVSDEMEEIGWIDDCIVEPVEKKRNGRKNMCMIYCNRKTLDEMRKLN